MAPHESLFSLLPYEIFQHILSFGADSELKNPSSRNSDIRMVAKFQSINKKISNMKEMQDYFNAFWWKVFEKNFGIGQLFGNDLEKLRLRMIKRDEMKRKILLASYIKFKLYKRPKYDPNVQQQEEVKIIVLGEGGVGKSAITIFFIQHIFITEYDPTIEDTYRKYFRVDEEPAMVEILDTAGPEEFSNQYMRVGDAFVIVCSSSDENSVSDMRRHVENMLRCKDVEVNDMPVVFVLNKMDLLVSTNRNETIDRFRQEVNSIVSDNSLLNYSIIECSAKNGENIDAIFEETVRKQRLGGIDNLTLLKGCIEQDISYIEECKKRVQVKKKKCSIM
ncbi:ras family small GTPase [Naegleria gruberi]|uniref:Ras family small GTPase n=1 Tax=Naegleria gruberi TaxID=5762 RepID=D2W590_NAEGR|nr:ras family small GTPase [Naegleria gruberi]EFC35765.1 ras family small GTPase [Naegleria gruberi]|eukprot:XP_002668509.1 ras family small GTPase [Naegleria gruberi strain NEG-M]